MAKIGIIRIETSRSFLFHKYDLLYVCGARMQGGIFLVPIFTFIGSQ